MSTPRFIVLAEGEFDIETSKTASSAIRYLPDRITAVLDSRFAGQTAEDVLGFGGSIPVLATLEEALALPGEPADSLLIGIAPAGGTLPDDWRPALRLAIESGLTIWNGMHTFLGDDPELADLAARQGVALEDVRRPPPDLPVGTGLARFTDAYRVLAVGTDCNVGKMTACLQIRARLRERGVRANFGGTGQTGILVDGNGIAVDAVVADFIAGAAEQLTIEAAEGADLVLVEGQGSLYHPGYSGVTLGLMHGSMPQAMILSWMPGRPTLYREDYEWVRIPPLNEVIGLHEQVMSGVFPGGSRVVCIAANTYDLPEDEALRAIEEARALTGLPVSDPVRFDVDVLADAVISAMDLHRNAT